MIISHSQLQLPVVDTHWFSFLKAPLFAKSTHLTKLPFGEIAQIMMSQHR